MRKTMSAMAAVFAGCALCANASVIHELGSLSDQAEDEVKGWSAGDFSTTDAVYTFTDQTIEGETFDYTITFTAGANVTDLGVQNGGLVDDGSGVKYFQDDDTITISVAVSGNDNVTFDGFVNFGLNYCGTGDGFTIDGVDYIRGTDTNGDSDPRQGIAIDGGIIAKDSVDMTFISVDGAGADSSVLRGVAYQFSIPEPATLGLLAMSGLGIVAARRFRM